MGKFVVENYIKANKIGINPIGAKIGVLGLTLKKNCPDLRNTKVSSILKALKVYKCNVEVSDDWAIKENAKEYLGVDLVNMKSIKEKDAVIICVAHKKYCDLSLLILHQLLVAMDLVIDVKSILQKIFFLGLKSHIEVVVLENILVTGSSGFIGMHICKKMLI